MDRPSGHGRPSWDVGQGGRVVLQEVEIVTTVRSISAVVAEPNDLRGWVVMAAGRARDLDDAIHASRAFNRLGLGALALDLSGEPAGDAVEDAVLDARAWLEENHPGSLPVGLGGAGTAAAPVLRAARHHASETPALVLWNGEFDPEEKLPRSSVPTLLLVDRQRPRRQRGAQRRIARMLGPSAQVVVSSELNAAADRVIRDWYEQARLRGDRPPGVPLREQYRRAAVGLVAAAAVGVPVAVQVGVAAGAGHAARPITGGRLVPSHRIAGDGVGLGLSASAAAKSTNGLPGSLTKGSHHKIKHTTGGWLGKRIGAHRVRGDGFNPKRSILATGSNALIDGNGVKYFVNTNISFSTSSSASGGMSEASLTAAHADVSTRLGGVTASQLNDAFDGYNSMAVHVGGGAPPGPVTTGNSAFTIYNRNGVPTTDCSGRQIDFNPQMASGVRMWRKVYVPTVGSFARWVNFFSNTTSAPLTVTMYTANNLGSDSNTVITGSSNGNLTAETSDTWVSTFQNWSGNTSSDPRLAHVLQGAGAPVGMSMVSFANGDDNPWWAYTFVLAPGETKAIANYVIAADTKALAASGAGAIVSSPPLACLSGAEQSEIANWNLAAPVVVPPRVVAEAEQVGYCSVAGDRNKVTGAPLQTNTFLQLDPGQPATDPSYTGAVPANYLQGLGIGCFVPPGFTATGEKVGYLGHGDPGIYTYYAKTS